MKQKLTMNEWPELERPYEKMEQYGSGVLSDAELIAIIISSGINGKTSLEVAMELLKKVENLEFLNLASLEELQTVDGIGRVKSIRLHAAIELGKRIQHFVKNEEKEDLHNSSNAIAYFNNRLKYLPREEFHVALLNIKQKLIRSVQVATGDVKSIQIDAKEIFREAVRCNAAGIILAHNHPSGEPDPSMEDIKTTKMIAKIGNELNIPVLDHIIVSAKATISLKSAGYF
ncbi:MAG: DNA repair protein RadC [Clostridiaceae bacterium]|nr:DNA repair protein RadC [Clostridiaceae bacterium]